MMQQMVGSGIAQVAVGDAVGVSVMIGVSVGEGVGEKVTVLRSSLSSPKPARTWVTVTLNSARPTITPMRTNAAARYRTINPVRSILRRMVEGRQ
jgi:hypothetical protein